MFYFSIRICNYILRAQASGRAVEQSKAHYLDAAQAQTNKKTCDY